MSNVKAKIRINDEFEGQLDLGSYKVEIAPNRALPYDLLQAALAGCLHSTFLDVLEKEELSINFVEYNISGVKRDSVPKMLEEVTIKATIDTSKSETKVKAALELACRYCSIFQTLAKVAKMELIVEFESFGTC
ncbi:MAG: OsmC family protein [Erysipelotrichaceae bacterium]